MKNFETLAAGASGVVMNDELIDFALKCEEVPTAAANLFAFEPGEARGAKGVTIGSREFLIRSGGIFPVGLIERSEAAFDPVSIVTIRIEPEDNRSADMEELAGDNNFVARARCVRAWRM